MDAMADEMNAYMYFKRSAGARTGYDWPASCLNAGGASIFHLLDGKI